MIAAEYLKTRAGLQSRYALTISHFSSLCGSILVGSFVQEYIRVAERMTEIVKGTVDLRAPLCI